jgi:predicted Fe-Mo cluster-binding NifX family protein
VKSVVGRNSGRYRFLQADVVVRTGDLEKAHHLSEGLEEAIKSGVSNVERVVIHYEPEVRTSFKYGIPLQDPGGAVSEHLGKAPYFALIELSAHDGSLLRQEILANRYGSEEKQKGLLVARMLVEEGVDVLFLKESLEGKGPSYVLADGGVESRLTQASSLAEILSDLESERSTVARADLA